MCDTTQVKSHAEVVGTLLDHGADVNKTNDSGVTALTATLALLLRDRPGVRRHDLAQPRPPPADQVARIDVDSATRTIGRLQVMRANRTVINNLLNDSPLPAPTIYFDAAGQIQTLRETSEQRTADQKVVVDQKPKRAPATPQQQQQQLLKPQSAGPGGSGRPSPASSSKASPATYVDVGSPMSAAVSEQSGLPVHVNDEEEQR